MAVTTFYFLVFDGAEPCSWSPFGKAISEIRESTRTRVPVTYRSGVDVEVAITCADPISAPKEALGRTIGCFVHAEHLTAKGWAAFEPRFRETLNKIDTYSKHLPKYGFRVHAVECGETTVDRSVFEKIYAALALRAVPETAVQIDITRLDARFHDVIETSAYAIANNRELIPIFDGAA